MVMLFLAGVDKKVIIFLLMAGLVFLALGWGTFFQDYQKERIQTFLNPGEDPLDKGYNVIQSMVAIGSGGLTGKGIGHGSQSQLNFLPEKHTDFVFAAVGEESGFLGAFLVLLSFWVLFFRLIKISIEARDCFGRLLTVGILALFSYQVLVNIGMNLGIVPVAGISLPFLSYGGSFLFVSFALLGLVMSIWRKRKTGRGLFNEPDLI
jgi:rod shape determining protein RodA